MGHLRFYETFQMEMDNTELRKELTESRESFDETLALKDEDFQYALDSKDIELKYFRSEIIRQRENCQIEKSKMSQIMKLPSHKSCNCC